jgi:Neuraminidase (sialidase)
MHETKFISHQPEYYHAWPTVARRKNGELLLTYSGGREAHICPFGRVEMMRSHDDGKTWGWPCVVLDTESDDRDSGVLETAKGTILATTFTSLAYAERLAQAEKKTAGQPDAWPEEKLRRWHLAHDRLTEEQRKAMLGAWMIRSTDDGKTWSAPYRSIVNSPHGPIQLADGRLLYAGKALWQDNRIGVCESKDDGQSWQWLAEIPARPGDDFNAYHELHAVEAANGRLIAHIRNHNKTDAASILQSESTDGGKTWSLPHAIGVWGLPSFLLRLKDDRLLMTYGHRRAPFGNQARLSSDNGDTWSEPILISSDGDGSDIGYPSTVQLGDGSLLSIWYEKNKGKPNAMLRQAHWSIEG